MNSHLAFVAAFLGASALAQTDQDFARYPAKLFRGHLVEPKDLGWPGMEYDLAKGINFGGHFTYVIMPCGTECWGYWFVDRRTGKSIRAPEGAKFGIADIQVRRDSNLAKVTWAAAGRTSAELRAPCYSVNFVWTGKRFSRVSPLKRVRCPKDL